MKEKRRHPRLSFSVDVEIHTSEQEILATTQDICTTGLLVKCVDPLPLDERCEVVIYLSSGDLEMPIRAHGQVVRHVEDPAKGCKGMGIKFIDMDEDSQEALWRLVRYNTPVSGEEFTLE